MDALEDALPDFAGSVTICGEGRCGPIPRGDAKFDETQAKVWGLAASTSTASVVMLARDAGAGDLWACQAGDAKQAQEWKNQLLKRNPFHNNPTYEGSDGMIIGETAAILRYVALNSLPDLYPEEIKVRGHINWAMDVVDG